jgi:DNA-binding PadR family transcriptional regulator
MPRGSHLGEFEYLVMLALMRLGEDAYGMRVRREIQARAQRDVTIGSVYATLDRLERKGLAESSAGIDETGRARKYFGVTAAGSEAMRRHLEAIVRMGEGLALHEKLDAR